MNSKKIKISVLLLTQNSELSVGRTLESVKNFDEIVVIDGGSSDKTQEIAQAYPNVKFVSNPWPGFVQQRNFSVEQASNEWCFMIDSDEACTPELERELYLVASDPSAKVLYRVMRTEFFGGRAIEHGFGKSTYQERLLRKSRVRYDGGVHHSHLIDGEYAGPDHKEVANLDPKFRVLHDENYGIDEWLRKFPRFTILIANEKIARGRSANIFVVLLSFIGTFFQIYFKSFRNGKIGLVTSVLEAINRCMVKLYIYYHHEIEAPSGKKKEKKVNDLG